MAWAHRKGWADELSAIQAAALLQLPLLQSQDSQTQGLGTVSGSSLDSPRAVRAYTGSQDPQPPAECPLGEVALQPAACRGGVGGVSVSVTYNASLNSITEGTS